MTKKELLENARNSGYSIANITQGINGYPEGLVAYGIIGFDNYEEAEEFAKKYDLETSLFRSRDGWHFWEYRGEKLESLTVDDYLRDLGDDAKEFDTDDEIFGDGLISIIDMGASFEEIQEYVNLEKELREDLHYIDNETHALIVKDAVETEVVPRKMMSYKVDVWHWAVGVFVPKDYDPEGKEMPF